MRRCDTPVAARGQFPLSACKSRLDGRSAIRIRLKITVSEYIAHRHQNRFSAERADRLIRVDYEISHLKSNRKRGIISRSGLEELPAFNSRGGEEDELVVSNVLCDLNAISQARVRLV
jgi:hypothetical protein